MGHEAAAPPKGSGKDTAPPLLRPMIALDTSLSHFIHNLTSPITPRSLLLLLEFLADFRFVFPVFIAVFFVTPSSSPLRSHFLSPLILCSLLDLLFIALVKFLVRRSRPLYAANHDPYNAVVSVDHFSFPSGHSSRVFFIASLFHFSHVPILNSISAPPFLPQHHIFAVDLLILLVWIWAFATAFSRLALGRHYVLDVFVGASFGVLEALFTLRYLKFQLLS